MEHVLQILGLNRRRTEVLALLSSAIFTASLIALIFDFGDDLAVSRHNLVRALFVSGTLAVFGWIALFTIFRKRKPIAPGGEIWNHGENVMPKDRG